MRAIENNATQLFIEEQKKVINQLDNKKVTLGEAQLKIEHFWAGSLRKAVINGDIENGSLMAGQSVSLVKKKQKVKEIFEEILNQAKQQLFFERKSQNE